jgi:hypothetical protein
MFTEVECLIKEMIETTSKIRQIDKPTPVLLKTRHK